MQSADAELEALVRSLRASDHVTVYEYANDVDARVVLDRVLADDWLRRIPRRLVGELRDDLGQA